MDELDTREWLLTNGLGSFASGTVCDARTRTYHGWLMAALDPPSQRTLLLSHLDASLEIAGHIYPLGTNFWMDGSITPLGFQWLHSFALNPVPTWIWSRESWQLTRRLVMPSGFPTAEAGSKAIVGSRTLIHYHYEGKEAALLRLRPIIGDRNFHHQQSAVPELNFSQVAHPQHIDLQALRPDWTGTPWQLRWSAGEYQVEGTWYWNFFYPEEQRRGLNAREDLYSPGYLTVSLQPGDAVMLEARVGDFEAKTNLNPAEFDDAVEAEAKRLNQLFAQLSPSNLSLESAKKLARIHSPIPPNFSDPESTWSQLLRASDQFIVYRDSIAGPTAIAGYPWFNDWGRDTLIALPGLALTTGRFALAKGLLETFGRYCRHGLIPNTFPDAGAEPLYNSIDASLWWIETLGLYLEATQDWAFLGEQYPVVRQIYKAFCAGTLYNIHLDATDGLVSWEASGVAITWMDAVIDGQPMTPRCGKPVEINALWYSALCWASQWAERLAKDSEKAGQLLNQRDRYLQQAQQVKNSLYKFWNPEQQYFYDTIEPDDRTDGKIRPNAVLALSLSHCGFPDHQARSVLQMARDRLLTPYGLRSLDPSDSEYIGHYGGTPWQRDRAYHQGTVWSWLIGPFIRAWKRFYPSEPLPCDLQPLINHFHTQACLGSISEIFDGDLPHAPQGAFAQAWSVAELIRHGEF